MPARLTAWAITWPPMSAPWVRLKAPRTARPIGVRAVDTMTASTMVGSFSINSLSFVIPGDKHRDDSESLYSAAARSLCRSSSISSFFDSLPTAVFGSMSRNSKCAGIS